MLRRGTLPILAWPLYLCTRPMLSAMLLMAQYPVNPVRCLIAMLVAGQFFATPSFSQTTSVDIDLFDGGDADSLEVRMRANGATFDGLVTGLTFTVRWPMSSPATLGARTLRCPLGVPVSASPQVTSGAFHYCTFNAFGLEPMADACPANVWTQGTWVTLMKVKVEGITGCVGFNIVNDAWTTANNRNYYVGLNGVPRSGNIDAVPVDLGNCAVDCLGNVGGTAVPGSACDDADVCTVNDTWSPACLCVGTVADADSDGTCDALDGCPSDPLKTSPGLCGCGTPDADTDSDGTPDCTDACPADPLKTAPGICGCGTPDTDTDADGTPDCNDACPGDPLKTTPGNCGCGNAEPGAPCDDGSVATINDAVQTDCGCAGDPVDCDDQDPCTLDSYDGLACQHDPLPDTDNDGTCDLVDECPEDPLKTVPGQCGCGVVDTDTDNDGIADCIDDCPELVGTVGSSCDDGLPGTVDDEIGVDCVCAGIPVDCDDQDDCTADSYNGAQCVNAPLPDGDGDGACDLVDGCPEDPFKIEPGQCGCGVADTDTDSDLVADCTDGCPEDPLKTSPGQCGCGQVDADTDGDLVADCVDGCPALAGVPGDACDDGNALTVNDVLTFACVCEGTSANDTCAQAIELVLNAPVDCPGNAVVGTNVGATSVDPAPGCTPAQSVTDVWYTFNTGAYTMITVDVQPGTATGLGWSISDGCAGVTLACQPEAVGPVNVDLPPGTQVWVRIWADLLGATPGDFSVCVAYAQGDAIPTDHVAGLSLVPNPAHGQVTLRSGSAFNGLVHVHDAHGRNVRSMRVSISPGAGCLLNVDGLSPGVYGVRIGSQVLPLVLE